MAFSSSSLSRSWLYHVFLSFRGLDVRKGFLSHVLKELKSRGIIPFIDDEIKRGESVGPVLVGAIRQSRVAIVFLSRNYASSSWCLDELVEIMKCREETGDFGKAFDETCVGKTEEVKQAWMTALKDVAGIAGYHSSNCDNEVEMISKVASDVTVELGFTPSKDFDDLVGIGARITEIKSKLILQSEQVKVIVLVGPPGISKTRTARVLYNQLSPGFPFSTFLEDIKGSYEKPCGNDYLLKLRLQKNLLSEILNQRDIERPSARSLRSDRSLVRARSIRSDRAPARARSLRSDRAPGRARSLRGDRALARARSPRSDRAPARARSLRSDRSEWTFGRYVATEPWLDLGCYVATERSTCSVVA
ncbi:hypothetical protein F2Q68_00010684 [Brassica cretica]|uniref:TIR domain-containing protein n=1 Tax=Brassica cretica TaxID=69181 RepID=A0A8S9KYG1_BRACR|nr:hypothetical protein F2Q68_00010684 [Brassica cretica]